MVKVNKSLLARILLIVLVVIFNIMLPTLQPFGALITGSVAIILLFAPSASDILQGIIENRKSAKETQEYEKEIRSFLQPKLIQTLYSFGSTSYRADRLDVYDKFIEKSFSDLSDQQREMLVLLSLCSISRKVRSNESLQVYSNIQLYINKLSIYKVDPETKPFLSAYRNLFKESLLFGARAIFDISTISESEYRNLLDEFINNFSKDAKFAYVRNELFQSEELRRTLVQLIRNGELSSFGINEETLNRLQRSLREKQRPSEAYLLLGNKITDDVKQLVKRFPHLGGFVAWSGVPGKRNVILVGFVIKPTKYYGSPQEFMKVEIEPHLKGPKEFLLTAIPIDFMRSKACSIPSGANFISKNMRDCQATIDYFGRGYLDDLTVWKIITNSTIKTDELLAIIPFNVFVPDLAPSEREFIIKNYTKAKTQLNVNRLDDWAKKKPDEICNALISSGKPSYNDVELQDLYGVNDISQLTTQKIEVRFSHIANEIIGNAEKFAQSISEKEK